MEETTLAVQAQQPAAETVPAPSAAFDAAPDDGAAATGPTAPDIAAAPDGDHAALLAELQQYRARAAADAQDQALLADPDRGAVYGSLRDRVQQLLAHCAGCGTPVTAESAFAAVLYDQLPTLQSGAADTARRSAMQALTANAAASPGPLSGAAPAAPDFENMSSEEFAKYHYRALHGGWK